jgi:dolichol-phosphate mannosyltransferase
MDADLSHNPAYILDFVKAIESGADFLVGSRYIQGGSTPNWSWYRKLLSVGGNFYTRAVLSKAITDYTGGFNGYSIGLLKKMNLASINHEGYGFLISFKYAAIKYSSHIIEVPIQFLDREYGESKMPISTVFRNFLLVLTMKLKESIGQRPY